MRIAVATPQVPFVRGGAEMHAEGLRSALISAGHEAEIVTMPFKWYPPQQLLDSMLACTLLDLTESCGNRIDLVIGLKFPAWLVQHDSKVLWILHQYRDAYDLWGHELGALHLQPNGMLLRSAIESADRSVLAGARRVFANSRNVAARLQRFCQYEAPALYHPPPAADRFYSEEARDYIYFPSRLCPMKRQDLVLRSLAETRHPVQVWFSGAPDVPDYLREMQEMARRLGVADRARWLGQVSDEEKVKLYARACGVVYPPVDEDYGYVPLEAMLSSKAVITCTDSGGPLEFVISGETGLVCQPLPGDLAAALDSVWENRSQTARWGANGGALYRDMNISWSAVVRSLLG